MLKRTIEAAAVVLVIIGALIAYSPYHKVEVSGVTMTLDDYYSTNVNADATALEKYSKLPLLVMGTAMNPNLLNHYE